MSHRAFADLIDYEEFWDDARQVDPGAVGRRIPRFQLPDPMQGDPTAWFLGPRGENFELFAQLILDAMSSNKTFRLDFHPEDATVITESMKARAEYRAGVDSIRQALNELLSDLRDHTTPYYSWRYQGHMLWDTTIPSLVGYFATMLHNPNNVTVQASPLTTLLEQQVGWDLCAMLGFPFGTSVPDPHGHLTSGGTVANIEATWSARELRYLPLVVRDLLTEPASGPLYWLEKKEAVTASYMGEEKSIVDLSEWELLNLSQDDVLDLPRQILCLGPPRVPGDRSQPRWTERAVWELLLKNSVNWLGLLAFHHRYLVGDDVPPIGPPVVFTPASKHYSWPKAMALLGGGSGPSSVMDIKVDRSGRMDIEDLERNLNRARAAWRPTLLVVGVAGSTEESSVDDIGAILDMRCRFRQEGYEFNVHIDAAWGGYFLSSIRKDFDDPGRHDKLGLDKFFDPAAWSYRLDKEAGRFEVHDLPGSGRAELGNDCSPDRLDTERKEAPKPVDEMTEGRDKPAYPVFLSQYVVDAFRMIADADSATVDPHKTGYMPEPSATATGICVVSSPMARQLSEPARTPPLSANTVSRVPSLVRRLLRSM
jgi:glutamate/tyrosine decarboxylase-like PLP-dependent enzyme